MTWPWIILASYLYIFILIESPVAVSGGFDPDGSYGCYWLQPADVSGGSPWVCLSGCLTYYLLPKTVCRLVGRLLDRRAETLESDS